MRFALVGAVIGAVGFASGLAPAQLLLQPNELVVVTSEWNRPVQAPVRCDANGNIYLRTYEATDRRTPVLRVDNKGRVAKLSFEQDTDLSKASVYDFGVSADGEVFQVANRGDNSYLIRFSSDGAYRGNTKVETRLWAAHVAPLGSQNFLITGFEPPEETEAGPPKKALTLIINSSGKVVRNLSLPGDVAFEPRPARHAEMSASSKTTSGAGVQPDDSKQKGGPAETDTDLSALPLLLGDIEDGGDGYAYLLRRSSPALVYVISPSGQVVRTLKLASPGPDLMVGGMHVAAGRVALLFAEPPEKLGGRPERLPRVAVVFDATTGEKIAQYEVPGDVVGAFACYDASNRFAFVRSSQDKLAIRWASTR